VDTGPAPEQLSLEMGFGRLDVLVAGGGPPLTVLHDDIGRGGWSEFHARLARRFRVYAPALPGWDASARPDWLRTVADLAGLVGSAMDRLEAAPGAVSGLGFGGWVAAELAARSPGRVSALHLHAPVGIRPAEGEVVDQFLLEAARYVELGFRDKAAFEQAFPGGDEPWFDAWDHNREMTTRIAWKPYMHHPGLRHLLREIRLPALVTWGADDRIVPRAAAAAHAEAIPGARFLDFPRGGHRLDLEDPEALAAAVLDHLAAPAASR
jgi:pimeloyl-ACP methyl ester carboxylesterase